METKFDHKPEGLGLVGKITIPGLTKSHDESEPSTESNEGKVFQEMESQPDPYEEKEVPIQSPLDLLKSALTLIIAKAEAIDITYDKPKILGKLKGALELLNQN